MRRYGGSHAAAEALALANGDHMPPLLRLIVLPYKILDARVPYAPLLESLWLTDRKARAS